MVQSMWRLRAALAAVVLSCSVAGAPFQRSAALVDPDPPTTQVEYVLPISAPVADFFRPPSTPWGPGNRGWEFASVRGQPAVAVGPGVVLFAGSVAGRGVVTLLHPGGLLSSVTGLIEVSVSEGAAVRAGAPVGTAGVGLHLGFRFEGIYLDPASVYGSVLHAVLVPIPG